MDPFLLAHCIADALFDIGPGLTPPSLRDQTIRGYLFAIKATKAGLIGPTKPLLVVGAGLAGAVTGITAATLGVTTVVIDSHEEPLNVQLGCYSRVICPAQYDWPSNHWLDGALPWSAGKIPLTWREGRAGVVAIYLAREFLLAVDRNPRLTFRPHTIIPDDERIALKSCDLRSKGHYLVNFLDTQTQELDPKGPYKFGAMISCVGSGPEQTTLGSYTGFRFWEMDPYSQPRMNLNVVPRVFISGGGDGALQDFLRVVTRRESAKEIYLTLPGDLRGYVEQSIRTLEDNHKRTHIWVGKDDDCEVHQLIQDNYEAIVRTLFSMYGDRLEAAIRPMVGHMLNGWTVLLSYPCTHFTSYYALNRFLTLLMAEYFEKTFQRKLINSRALTTRIQGVSHICKNSRWDCHGEDHTVIWDTFTCNERQTVATEDGPYNIIMLRHGPKRPKKSFFEVDVIDRRQLLPYYL